MSLLLDSLFLLLSLLIKSQSILTLAILFSQSTLIEEIAIRSFIDAWLLGTPRSLTLLSHGLLNNVMDSENRSSICGDAGVKKEVCVV